MYNHIVVLDTSRKIKQCIENVALFLAPMPGSTNLRQQNGIIPAVLEEFILTHEYNE